MTALFFFIIVILSAIIHEYSHGWVAEQLGDPTARLAGRLTLNPIAHIDPIGTILVPLILVMLPGGFIFGWAKPVPFNPLNLRDKRWGPALVALAGPASNLLIALSLAIVIRLLGPGSFASFLALIVYINILLAVFNLVPIPPLDGSKVLYALLPNTPSWWRFKLQLEQYGMILVIMFIFIGWQLITPIIYWLFRLLVGFNFY